MGNAIVEVLKTFGAGLLAMTVIMGCAALLALGSDWLDKRIGPPPLWVAVPLVVVLLVAVVYVVGLEVRK